MGVLSPSFEVKPLREVGEGKLVRYSPDGNTDVYAITARLFNDKPALVVLDSLSLDRPIYISEKENGHIVAVLEDWRIEPNMISVSTVSRRHARNTIGSILVREGEPRTASIIAQDGMSLSLESFKVEQIPDVSFAAVTTWKLWVPQFDDGRQPAWKAIFCFPKQSEQATP